MKPHPVLILVLSLALYAINSLALIWSLNTLFNTGIPYSFNTWLAGVILFLVIRYTVRVGRSYEHTYQHAFDEEEEEFALRHLHRQYVGRKLYTNRKRVVHTENSHPWLY